MSQDPNVIYLYTDGFENIQSLDWMAARLQTLNPNGGITVHCIILRDDPNHPWVRDVERMAKNLGWTVRTIPRPS